MTIERVAKAGLPAGEKMLREGAGTVPLSAADIRLVMEGWSIKREIDELEARLKENNARLIEAHGADAVLIVHGVCRATIAGRQSVRITDPARLEAVLGARYPDLVKEKVSYTADQKLVQMAADGDEPLAPAIRACLVISESTTVTWRAEK